MKTLKSFFLRLRNLFRKTQLDRDLNDELASHLELHIADNLRSGMTPEEARRVALLSLGGLEQTKESVRDQRGFPFLETLLQDTRFGLRMLRKSPVFTAVAVLTLALGIGANTAIFSKVNSVLLRPHAYRQPQQLYLVREIIPELSQTYPTLPANLPNFRVWQRECHSFDDVAIVEPWNMTLTGYGEAEQISGGRASSNLFDVLGIVPEQGRTFLPEEDAPGKDQVVVLTDSFWRGRFHADPAMVGRSITLDGQPFQVVGILPASFRFPRATQLGALVEFASRADYFK